MARVLIQESTLTAIADAIRAKRGGSQPIAVTGMASAIRSIPQNAVGYDADVTGISHSALPKKNVGSIAYGYPVLTLSITEEE